MRRITDILRDQSGQALLIGLAIVGVGSVVALPSLAFLDASLRSVDRSSEQARHYYAAEAAIEAVIADVRQGVDVLDEGYDAPEVSINGVVSQAEVEASPVPYPRARVLVDPHTTTAMASLEASASFTYVLHGVEPGTAVEVHWAYAPADPPGMADTRIEVFAAGTDPEDSIAEDAGNGSPHHFTLDGGSNDGGTLTLRFSNESPETLSGASFSAAGDGDGSWLSVVAGEDYVITASTGSVTLTAFVQAGPGGATDAERTGRVLGWGDGGG